MNYGVARGCRFKVRERKRGTEGVSGRKCEGGSVWTYDVNLRTVSKIRLGVIMCSSLRWLCEAASLCMWNRSILLRCGPFL
jgi:hypothetical protein